MQALQHVATSARPQSEHHKARDLQALTEALRSGHLGGVGLDVFWEEPADPADKLFSFPNVIALPHTGEPIKQFMSRPSPPKSSSCVCVLHSAVRLCGKELKAWRVARGRCMYA